MATKRPQEISSDEQSSRSIMHSINGGAARQQKRVRALGFDIEKSPLKIGFSNFRLPRDFGNFLAWSGRRETPDQRTNSVSQGGTPVSARPGHTIHQSLNPSWPVGL
jgi:hypothetical protein